MHYLLIKTYYHTLSHIFSFRKISVSFLCARVPRFLCGHFNETTHLTDLKRVDNLCFQPPHASCKYGSSFGSRWDGLCSWLLWLIRFDLCCCFTYLQNDFFFICWFLVYWFILVKCSTLVEVWFYVLVCIHHSSKLCLCITHVGWCEGQLSRSKTAFSGILGGVS